MQNGGQRNSQSRDMSQCVEVCRAGSIAHPQPFLTCGFEAGIVTLTLRPQGISPFERKAAAVNGKSVVIGNGFIFRAAPVFLPVIPVLVVAGTFAGFGLTEGAAVFLPGTIIVGRLSVLVHGEACLADRIASRKRFQNLHTTRIERDKCLALIDRFHGIVDAFHIVALVGKEGAFFQRNRLIRGREDLSGDGGIGDIARRGQLIERQAGDAVHQHDSCTPSRTHTAAHCSGWRPSGHPGRSPGAFRAVFLGKLAFCKGFWIVLLRVCHDGRGIQANK